MQFLQSMVLAAMLVFTAHHAAATERTTLVHPVTKEKVVLVCPRGKYGFATFYDRDGKYLRKKTHEPPSHAALVNTYKRLGYR